MISKRSNTASAKGRDALCVPVQKVKDMEEVSDNGRSVPDGLLPFGSSQQAVSPVPASIPSAFTSDWRGEIAVAATEHHVTREALNAAVFTWLMKIARWEAVDIDAMLKGYAREQQARMGMSMAMGEALAVAQAIDARRAETHSGSVVDESAVAKPCAQGDAA